MHNAVEHKQAVIGDARVAIEIKSVEEVMGKHLKGLCSQQGGLLDDL